MSGVSEPYEHVVCCVDDSPAARRALAEALRVRALAPGRLSLVHVLEPPNLVVSVAAQLGGGVMNDPELEEEAARLWLGSLAEDAPGAEAVLLRGDAAEAACAFARSSGCDLLVVASHAGGLEAFEALEGLGSFARHLSHHAPCPVLLVPPPPKEGDRA